MPKPTIQPTANLGIPAHYQGGQPLSGWGQFERWLGTPQAGIAFGEAARAIMGPYQQSWPAALGGASANWARSTIAAEQAKELEQKRQAGEDEFTQLIRSYYDRGSQVTPNNLPGASRVVQEKLPSGELKVTITGNPQTTSRLQGNDLGALGNMAPSRVPGRADTGGLARKWPTGRRFRGAVTGRSVVEYTDEFGNLSREYE